MSPRRGTRSDRRHDDLVDTGYEAFRVSIPTERRRPVLPVLVAVLVIVIIVFAVLLVGNQSQVSDSVVSDAGSADLLASEVSDTPASEEEVAQEAFSPTPEALEGFSAEDLTFNLTGSEAPSLNEEEQEGIEEAIAAIEAVGEVSVVFYDLDSGLGIGYQADTAIYGASSFKALYALYICEDLVEGGSLTLSDNDVYLIETAVCYSNNDSYKSLRATYDGYDFDSWVTALGADDCVTRSDSNYPWYCARSSAKLWTEMYLYLQEGSDAAEWLEGLLSSTETSFLRDAVSSTGAEVLNKAGWYGGSETYNSVTDAGIITLDGRTYVMSIMTSMSYADDTVALYEQLAQALFDARDELAG